MLYKVLLLLLVSVSAAYGQLPPVSEVLRLAPQDGHPSSPVITALAVDPKGEFLVAAGDDHIIRIVDEASFTEQRVLRQHHGWVRSLDFRSDGSRMVSAGNDGQIVVWDRNHDWQIKQSMPDAPAIACVRFSPMGGILAAVGFDPQLFLLQPGIARRPSLKCGCNDMRVVAFSDDMRLVVAAGRSGDAHLFDPGTGQPAGHFELHNGRIHDLIFMPGSDVMVSVSDDRTVVVFDSLRGEVLHKIPIPGCKLFTVTVLDSTRVAVGGADNQIRIVDISRGTIEYSLSGHTGSIAVLKTSAQYLYSGSFDASIRRWPLRQILQQPRTVQRTTEAQPPKR